MKKYYSYYNSNDGKYYVNDSLSNQNNMNEKTKKINSSSTKETNIEMNSLILLSTGVLRRNPNTFFVTVDAMNVNPTSSTSVTVQLLDWSSGSPVNLPLVNNSTQTIAPNEYRTFVSQALPSTTFAYEVRILRDNSKNLVTNVFGLGSSPFNPEEGNNVIEHQLVKLNAILE